MFKSVEWKDGSVRILNQTKLPREIIYVDCKDVETVAHAIRSLFVRGAPAIGIAAAFGIALSGENSTATSCLLFQSEIEKVALLLSQTRPTAVNLFLAITRMKETLKAHAEEPILNLKKILLAEANAILNEDIAANCAIGKLGASFIASGDGVLTYCNTGALATGGYGTALGVIRLAHEEGKKISVFVPETRPILQGARLTMWELLQERIPATLITDNMVGLMMRLGKIQCCFVGADRIAANGDVANKIGTYTMAILAREHGIPFYVAAPTSTIDFNTASGDQIPIEERAHSEVTHVSGVAFAPDGIAVSNPAFDITPAEYIRAIITEKGIFKPGEILQ
ncbi:MAG: S-methyl-5-thioribose-1-phosphate isomerase [Nitrospirae bacterium]|nr:S-methyl-5-thioribose-1-phosphate isomerase [Candidatus Troglogloeales bacterium]MBI3598438.1 S-methyl-5-thioribose-1-phosphate isomerase [Candidatus Troglogloeales bacterium]